MLGQRRRNTAGDDVVGILIYILAALFGISELLLSLSKRSNDKASSRDRQSLTLIWVVIGIAMFFGFGLTRVGPGLAPSLAQPLYIAGVVLILAGVALRWFSIYWLGRWFTVNVAIAEDQKLIDTGPYRYMRHPSYTGALLAFLGISLCIGKIISLLVIMLPVGAAFGWRIHVEDAVLAQAFGARWQAYAARTKRLIPGVY
jgi:protein-S-isoprenylcysteine O-methyltransferase